MSEPPSSTGKLVPDSQASPNQPRLWLYPAAVALFGLGLTLTTLDPSNCRPDLPEGPGVTLDETFNVRQGVFLADGLGAWVLGAVSLNDVFGHERYNPDHPPLGRLWLGCFHNLTQRIAPPAQPPDSAETRFVTVSARTGSAVAFSITILLIGWATGRQFGVLAGAAGSVSLLLMPRLFGHAHLAALESMTGLTWVLAVSGTAMMWTRYPVPNWKVACVSGGLIGLALLTKIQAILLPSLVFIWALWHWRSKAVIPLVVMLSVAAAVFLLGWPWLWQDFPGNLFSYFGRTTERIALHTWYLNAVHDDVNVPWHYPWVLLATTVPPGILVLAVWGMAVSRQTIMRDPQKSLFAGAVLAPVVLFSLPGVAVYDGVRLFLVSFPCLALFAGQGSCVLYEWMKSRTKRPGWVLAAVLGGQSVGLFFMHPYHLSYYSSLTGGLRGAESVGLEVNYWSDGLSRSMQTIIVQHVPEGGTLGVAPSMHPDQARELRLQSPLLQKHDIRPVGVDPKDPSTRYAVFFHRKADLPNPERLEPLGWVMQAAVRRQGVILASFWVKERGD